MKEPEKSPYTKLVKISVEKFKLLLSTKTDGKQDSKNMGRGEISIEKADGSDLHLCVFRNTIGKTLYQGRLMAISQKRALTDKPNKIQLKARFYSLMKDATSGKLKPEDCVITFSRKDVLAQYEATFEKAVQSQK